MKALNRTEEEFGVAMAPLIDVVFLLLVFFLVSTSFVKPEKSIDIVLPIADQAKKAPQEDRTLVVNVRETGVVVVEGRVLTGHDELVGVMEAARKANPDVCVVIRGDKKALHEHVVRVMNAALAVGIGDMSIAVFETELE